MTAVVWNHGNLHLCKDVAPDQLEMVARGIILKLPFIFGAAHSLVV